MATTSFTTWPSFQTTPAGTCRIATPVRFTSARSCTRPWGIATPLPRYVSATRSRASRLIT
jgi:hypothetical protein